MKAVKWFGPRDMRLVEVPKPEPKPYEVLLRIESVGVCGSDIHYYLDGNIGVNVLHEPTILGHEYAGIVEFVGDQADPKLLGKRVAVEPGIPCLQCEWCNTGHYNVCPKMFFPGGPGSDGALSEYYSVHGAFCFPVPESIPPDIAAMIEPLAVAIHTVELAELKPGETVAIIGLGPIGLMTANIAKFSGAEWIIGADLHEYRVQFSTQYGVDTAHNANDLDIITQVMAETSGRGVDVAIDCSNGSDALTTACHIVRPAGRIIVTGISGQVTDYFPPCQVRRKELVLKWTRRFKYNYPTAIRFLDSGKIDVRKLITHSFPLEASCDAFELVSGYKDQVLKASIDQF